MSLVLSPPPPTSIEPVTDVLHGVPITDPYRWLEDQNSPRTREWLELQTDYTRAYLDALSSRDTIRRRVAELLAVEIVSDLKKVGNRSFYMKRSSYQQQPVIMMREEGSDAETVLVYPSQGRGDNATTVKIMNISKDGNLLAYGIGRGADSSQSVEFLDVDGKQVLSDRLPRGFDVQLQFSPGGTGFYYSHKIIYKACPHYRAAYFHKFGTQSNAYGEIFFAGENPDIHLRLLGSVGGRLLGYLVTTASDVVTFDLYIQDAFHNNPASKILKQMQPVFDPFFVRDLLFAVTDLSAPNLRLVNIDLAHPECEHWVDVVPEAP